MPVGGHRGRFTRFGRGRCRAARRPGRAAAHWATPPGGLGTPLGSLKPDFGRYLHRLPFKLLHRRALPDAHVV
jgi:hypothetical protein